MKRSSLQLILIFIGLTGVAQPLHDSPNMEELYPPIPDWGKNLFECPDSVYQVAYFGRTEKSDSIIFIGGYDFQIFQAGYFRAEIINSKRKRQRPEYFYFKPNLQGRKYGWMEDCDKSGKVPKNTGSTTFETVSVSSLNGDSIVDLTTWWINKRDTICHFIDRYVYRQEKLVEYWSDSRSGENDCSWKDRESYSLELYTYPEINVKVTEYYSAKNGNRELHSTRTEISTFEEGNLIELKTAVFGFRHHEKVEKYFYTDGYWSKTETWVSGNLDSYVKKIPL